MNQGLYFRLNLSNSKIEDGVSTYDYIDLQDNQASGASPVYPITLTITEDSVKFGVHYFAYEDRENTPENRFKSSITAEWKPTNTSHTNETFLVLPFGEHVSDTLAKNIKQSYSSFFPDENSYLAVLLGKRYEIGINNINHIDRIHSYSSLLLWHLYNKEHFNLEDTGKWKRFLRKIILDFMFDLRHSEVFQTSKHYSLMKSGLMSDFFFSALLHKCEFYYHRVLISDAIKSSDESLKNISDEISSINEEKKILHKSKKRYNCILYSHDNNRTCDGNIPQYEECLNNRLDSLHKQADDINSVITKLYCASLLEAEEAWVKDIMNPLSDKHFEHNDDDFNQEGNKSHIFQKLLDPFKLDLIVRDSWFATPEEEMRRVCFTLKGGGNSDNGKRLHICNSEVLAEHYGINNRVMIRRLRSRISRWFLRRNAFLDTLHMHFPKVTAGAIALIICILPFIIIFFKGCLPYIPLVLVICMVFDLVCFNKPNLLIHNKHTIIIPSKCEKFGSFLICDRQRILCRRLVWWLLWLIPGLISINSYVHGYSSIALITGGLCLALFFTGRYSWAKEDIRIIQNIHITLPRLVASIAAAWFALAIGNELFISFFDAQPSIAACIMLAVIVFVFVLYEINKVIPRAYPAVKWFRSFGIVAISYIIAIIIGFFVINFMGERFLERSYAMSSWHEENDINPEKTYTYKIKNDSTIIVSGPSEQISNKEIVHTLDKYQTNSGIATISLQEDKVHIFILRDFLIQFAFLAMFIGVFIQMIFEEKSITEM